MENKPHHAHAPANRLIDSTSPYLLQHAHNPVEWYPWGPEAIGKARAENKPIFLSIGYSACHWCHVMEREVFEKSDIAQIMNEHFVNIKVDREERPDIDELYMLATQMTTGSGGWPMSVWLTPELEPFYAGTYFPPDDGYGRPGFPKLELAIADAWENKSTDLREQAAKIVDAVKHYADEGLRAGPADIDLGAWLHAALEQMADRFDAQNGGLGGAPKFPPSQALLLWLALLDDSGAIRLPDDISARLDRAQIRTMLTKTLNAMAAGGIYDQVGGAFARYSTDSHWLVPHFEKMLYDNAQLALAFAVASAQLKRPDYARIARQTLTFWLREMTSPEGAFYSTLDADSEGHEGKFYVWTPEEIHAALPVPDDAHLILRHFGITPAGNWEDVNVLHIAVPVEVLANENRVDSESMQRRIDALCEKLRLHRANRIPPALDDKILTGWNALMISAMAAGGRLLKSPRFLEAAHTSVGFLLTRHIESAGRGGKRLLRTSRNGNAHIDAYLEDYAYLLNALMDLIDSTSTNSLPGTMARRRAIEMADQMIALFYDHERGGFFFTNASHDKLFARMKNATDNATPSPNGVAIRALLRLARQSGQQKYRDIAQQSVQSFAGVIAKQPSLFATLLLALVEDAGAAAEAAQNTSPENMPAATPPSSPSAKKSAPRHDQFLTLHSTALKDQAPGDLFEIPLTLHIRKGYHINTNQPDYKELFATSARIRGDLPIEVTSWVYPSPQTIGVGEGQIAGYENALTIRAACTIPPEVVPGDYTLRATVMAQPCSHASCLPPERVSVEIALHVRHFKPE